MELYNSAEAGDSAAALPTANGAEQVDPLALWAQSSSDGWAKAAIEPSHAAASGAFGTGASHTQSSYSSGAPQASRTPGGSDPASRTLSGHSTPTAALPGSTSQGGYTPYDPGGAAQRMAPPNSGDQKKQMAAWFDRVLSKGGSPNLGTGAPLESRAIASLPPGSGSAALCGTLAPVPGSPAVGPAEDPPPLAPRKPPESWGELAVTEQAGAGAGLPQGPGTSAEPRPSPSSSPAPAVVRATPNGRLEVLLNGEILGTLQFGGEESVEASCTTFVTAHRLRDLFLAPLITHAELMVHMGKESDSVDVIDLL